MSDINLTQLIVNHLTRDELHNADFTDYGNELFVQKDHAGVSIGGVGVDALDTTNITNCITNIPQDIQLELNNGTLTLKAGSKVYVPNGVDTFDEVVIASDITRTGWGSGSTNLMVVYDSNNSTWGGFTLSECFSGSSAPSGSTNMLWYDTTNNKVKQTNNSGSTWSEGWSLPLFIINRSSGTITSIDQVFNGFGYIGSIVFTLPGVKGLIPDGRNADGTLKNGNVICNSVQISSAFTGTEDHVVILQTNGKVGWYNRMQYIYDKENNYIYNANNGVILASCVVGTFDVVNGEVQNFKPFDAFRALDYNDTEYIAHNAMPSDRYINLTLGASGAIYTAPADGYVFLRKHTVTENRYIGLYRHNNIGVSSMVVCPVANRDSAVFIPVKKGQMFKCLYDMDGTTDEFRFVYAEGVS